LIQISRYQYAAKQSTGLIEGAAEGAGLGHQFLRHLQRTRLLLHLVDIAPIDGSVDAVAQARTVIRELKKYDRSLYEKPRWLVLNKIDMVPPGERQARANQIVRRLRWKGPVFLVSALAREGLDELVRAIYAQVSEKKCALRRSPDSRFARGATAES